jgi:nucleoid-associated protein YgaU
LEDGSIHIGTVRLDGSRDITPEYITLHATARLETQLGSHVRLISEIEANPVRVGTGDTVLTFDNLMTALIGALDYHVWGAVIIVDGTSVATLPSTQTAESLLTDIAQGLRQGNTAASFHNVFAQNIEIALDYVPRAELMTEGQARSALTMPREVPGIHIVRQGDTFWGISQITGMSESDIAAANPDADQYRLYVGQRLAVVHTVPVLTAVDAD